MVCCSHGGKLPKDPRKKTRILFYFLGDNFFNDKRGQFVQMIVLLPLISLKSMARLADYHSLFPI